jgi:lipopolysaccharide/colanic/teichoic acid biosynthesis glycosyltransferase
MQRLLDIVLSVMALLVLSPFMLPIVILLRLTGEGEVLFLQDRVGKGGKSFKLCKFATMLKNSPAIGTGTVTLKNDPRILPIGHFLRKSKVNELPQLLNILKGDMSIIGPRPQTQRCFDAFTPASKRAIVQVRPGITGIGSIIFHDEENVMHSHSNSVRFYDEVIAPYKGALEEWYISHQGLWTYLVCIVVTAWVVLNPKSNWAWRVFGSLPPPPEELAGALQYRKKAFVEANF